MKKPTHKQIAVHLRDALLLLVVRFPLEGWAQPSALGNCKCNQYQDTGGCRHLDAIEALERAQEVLGE